MELPRPLEEKRRSCDISVLKTLSPSASAGGTRQGQHARRALTYIRLFAAYEREKKTAHLTTSLIGRIRRFDNT